MSCSWSLPSYVTWTLYSSFLTLHDLICKIQGVTVPFSEDCVKVNEIDLGIQCLFCKQPCEYTGTANHRVPPHPCEACLANHRAPLLQKHRLAQEWASASETANQRPSLEWLHRPVVGGSLCSIGVNQPGQRKCESSHREKCSSSRREDSHTERGQNGES
jgi:hypothetical protein